MTLADFRALFGDLWPYAAVLLIGFLPTEIWRLLGVVLAQGLDEDSEALLWVKAVASTLLAAVVAKIVLAPTGALASVPQAARIAALSAGVAGMFLSRRSVVVSVVAGELTLLAAGFLMR